MVFAGPGFASRISGACYREWWLQATRRQLDELVTEYCQHDVVRKISADV